MAGNLKGISERLEIGFIYKTSLDKANRTDLSARRGVGMEATLGLFADLHRDLAVPVLSDVHEKGQCAEIAEGVDVL